VTAIHPARDPFDFPPNTKDVSYRGATYTLRELTVAEMDECRDAATSPDKFDGRLMTRMMITIGATEPTIDLEQLSKFPQRLYGALVDLINELNDPEALAAESEKDDPGKS
jgi:hypothetical protein